MIQTYTVEQLDALRSAVQARLSPRRFKHTQGVAQAAEKIARLYMPEHTSELIAAALLHDIAKEFPLEEQFALMQKSGEPLPVSGELCPAIFHAYAALPIVRAEFSVYATPAILNAICRHTVGSPDMTVFDEILFLADYIEDGRPYDHCIRVRSAFWAGVRKNDLPAERLLHLHRCVVLSMNFTMEKLIEKDNFIDVGLILARNALMMKVKEA